MQVFALTKECLILWEAEFKTKEEAIITRIGVSIPEETVKGSSFEVVQFWDMSLK